jgi:hypothetical protein
LLATNRHFSGGTLGSQFSTISQIITNIADFKISTSSPGTDSKRAYLSYTHRGNNVIPNKPLTVRQFDNVEKLLGVVRTRPEVIMVSEFVPLYNKLDNTNGTRTQTDAGAYVDAKFDWHSIQRQKLSNILNGVFSTANEQDTNEITTQFADYSKKIDQIITVAQDLQAIINKANTTKKQFDFRNLPYPSIENTLQGNWSTYDTYVDPNNKSVTLTKKSALLSFAQASWGDSVSLAQFLGLMGYQNDNIEQQYTSTKVWLQALYEAKSMFETHSLSLADLSKVQQARDTNSSKLLKPPGRFMFNDTSNSFDKESIPTITEIISMTTTSNLSRRSYFSNVIAGAYVSLFREIPGGDVINASTYLTLLSKEFRYSYGLATNNGLGSFFRNIGFISQTAAAPGANLSVFANIFGTLFDFPTTDRILIENNFNNQSLASMCWTFDKTRNNGLVLNTQAIATNGVQSGAEYYVDSVFDIANIVDANKAFDLTRVKDYVTVIDQKLTNLRGAARAMNWLSEKYDEKKVNAGGIEDPALYYDYVWKFFVDKDSQMIRTNDGIVSALMRLARDDYEIRSCLFVLILNLISRANFGGTFPPCTNTAERDNTITQLSQKIIYLLGRKANVSSKKITVRNTSIDYEARAYAKNNSGCSEDDIHEILTLRTKDSTLDSLIIFMKSVYSAFKRSGVISGENRTMYSGAKDTVVLMTVFHVICMIFKRHSNFKFDISNRVNLTVISEKNQPRTYDVIVDNYVVGPNLISVKSGQKIVKKTYDAWVFSASKVKQIFTLTNDQAVSQQATTNLYNARVLNQQMITSKLNAEKALHIAGYVALFGTIKQFRDNLQSFISFVEMRETTNGFQNILTLISGLRPEYRNILFSEQQLMLLISSAYDAFGANQLQQRAHRHWTEPAINQPRFELNSLEENVVDTNLRNMFNATFNDGMFASKTAANKHIITVGLPTGFIEKLKHDTAVSTNPNAKPVVRQNDLIRLSVYKVDLRFPDIAFVPQHFVFETTRFAIKDPTKRFYISDYATIDDVIDAFPTRDLLQNSFTNSPNSVFYGGKIFQSVEVAMDTPDYSFLTTAQKRRIQLNHVVSYMLEIYLKALTDLNVSERAFCFNPDDNKKQVNAKLLDILVRCRLQSIISTGTPASIVNNTQRADTSGYLFANSCNVALDYTQNLLSLRDNSRATVSGDIQTILNGLNDTNLDTVMHELRMINELANTYSGLTNADAITRSYFSPRMYDRIFNIIVDPDDFEVDVDKTNQSKYGSKLLGRLVNPGDSTQAEFEDVRNVPYRNSTARIVGGESFVNRSHSYMSYEPIYKQRFRDKSSGDVTFEKYFIVASTYDQVIS